MNAVNGALTWLHAQASALFSNIGAVVANRPEPARQVVISTLVTIFVIVAAIKIIKKK